jgi:hypothetical protein
VAVGDPLGVRSSTNFYSYVDNRVTRYFDPYGLQAADVSCSRCSSDQQGEASRAFKRVCSQVAVGKCREVLGQYELLTCFQQKCKSGINVICYEKNCDDRESCGGPCTAFFTDATKFVYLHPNAFDPQKPCSLTGTMAHEMAHMCGIGPDGWGRDPEANKKKANDVDRACR